MTAPPQSHCGLEITTHHRSARLQGDCNSYTRPENAHDRKLCRFWRDDEGQDLVEYALLVALIAVAPVGAMELLTGGISTAFSERDLCAVMETALLA